MSESLGARLRKLRKDRGLHQMDVAASVDIARSYLTHMENDRREGNIELLCELADFFNVSLDYLIRGKSTETKAEQSRIEEIWQKLPKDEQESFLMLLERRVS